jgi:ribosomal-protein-alanine N-acetyltransferase
MKLKNKIDVREALPKEIVSGKIILRKPMLKDAQDLIENGNEKELNYLTYYLPYPFGETEAKNLILENKTNKELIRFAIELKKAPDLHRRHLIFRCPHLHEEKRVIGLLDLYNWKARERRVKIGYWIGKDYRRKGYLSEIMPKVIDFAFKKMNVEKITAKVLIDNIASQRLLEKFNFVKIKITPGDKFLDGKRVDTISYELTNEQA